MDTLRQDTLWLPLVSKLIKEIRAPHVIKNNFPNDLKVSLLPYTEYYKYYGATNLVDIEAEWALFHDNYSDRAVLVDLSQVVTDGKRAVFYYGWRCNGLCGNGSLIMFYKEGAEWKLVAAIPMWYN